MTELIDMKVEVSISAKEASSLSNQVSHSTWSRIMRDIKQNATDNLTSTTIGYMQGSSYDRQIDKICAKLEALGCDCEVRVDKFLFMDFGCRALVIKW